jgi:hypothetical protein
MEQRWQMQIDGQNHDVNLKMSSFPGKGILMVDKELPISLRRHLFGQFSQNTFEVKGAKAEIKCKGFFNPYVSLYLDGTLIKCSTFCK